MKFLKDLWNEHVSVNFAEDGFLLTLFYLTWFLFSLLILIPVTPFWALNEVSKAWFKSDNKK